MAKKIEVDLNTLEALAAKGYTAAMICDAVGISTSKAYNDKEIMAAIRKGKAAAHQKVVDDLMTRASEDPSSAAAIFLAKKLKVFDDPYPTGSPKTPGEAVKKIANIYTAVAKGQLDQEKGNYLISFLEKFIKVFEISELEKRISKLEEVHNGKG